MKRKECIRPVGEHSVSPQFQPGAGLAVLLSFGTSTRFHNSGPCFHCSSENFAGKFGMPASHLEHEAEAGDHELVLDIEELALLSGSLCRLCPVLLPVVADDFRSRCALFSAASSIRPCSSSVFRLVARVEVVNKFPRRAPTVGMAKRLTRPL